MNNTQRITIAGFGGQGVMLFGQILAYAGANKNLNSLWVPSYGPETRGGTANCAVILSPEQINSPVFSKADVVIVFNKPSLQKFRERIEDHGILLYNSSLIDEKVTSKAKVYALPINEVAAELGNPRVANMVMLGAYLELTKTFSDEEIIKALAKIFGEAKKSLIDINRQAILAGRKLILAYDEHAS